MELGAKPKSLIPDSTPTTNPIMTQRFLVNVQLIWTLLRKDEYIQTSGLEGKRKNLMPVFFNAVLWLNILNLERIQNISIISWTILSRLAFCGFFFNSEEKRLYWWAYLRLGPVVANGKKWKSVNKSQYIFQKSNMLKFLSEILSF